jgi:hypothetical protein
MRHIVRLLVVIVWALLVIGCGNDEDPSISEVACSLASIAISPTSSTRIARVR